MDREILGGHALRSHNLFYDLFSGLESARLLNVNTGLNSFTSTVSIFGLPSRVCCDRGGENSDVSQLMEVVRGDGRGSALRGSSTHNQWIERSWVDMC